MGKDHQILKLKFAELSIHLDKSQEMLQNQSKDQDPEFE